MILAIDDDDHVVATGIGTDFLSFFRFGYEIMRQVVSLGVLLVISLVQSRVLGRRRDVFHSACFAGFLQRLPEADLHLRELRLAMLGVGGVRGYGFLARTLIVAGDGEGLAFAQDRECGPTWYRLRAQGGVSGPALLLPRESRW